MDEEDNLNDIIISEKKYNIKTDKNNEMELYLRNINNEKLSINLFSINQTPSKKYECKCNLEEFQRNRFFKIFNNIEEIIRELDNKIMKSVFIEENNLIIIDIQIGLTVINEILIETKEKEKNKDEIINELKLENNKLKKNIEQLKNEYENKLIKMMKTIDRLEKEKAQLIENFSYQKVEYIQSSGNQYIDTLFADPNGIRVCCKAMWLNGDGGTIIGSHNESENEPYGRNYAFLSSDKKFEFGYGETNEKFGNGGPNIEYEIDFKTTKTDAYLKIKGGIYKEWKTFIKTSGQKISENNNLIFTNQWAMNVKSFYTKAKLYYVRIFDSTIYW